MADSLSIFSSRTDDDPAQQVAPVAAEPLRNIVPQSNLFPCPDCTHQCSRHAETCPQCGRFFQRFYSGEMVISRSGWSLTVAWGVILAWIIASILTAVVIVVLMILGVAIGTSGSSRGPVFPPYERRP